MVLHELVNFIKNMKVHSDEIYPSSSIERHNGLGFPSHIATFNEEGGN